MRRFLYPVFFVVFLTGCASFKPVERELLKSPLLTDHHTGFALYDWEARKVVVEHNADLHFVPASNTKLFSLYAGLMMLGDSIPALRYVVRGDSLIFWGTGNAAFLNPDLPDTAALAFLRRRPERLFFSTSNFTGERLGPGWSWSDYNEYYLPEIAPFPLYGNIVRFDAPDRRPGLFVSPRFFQDSLTSVSGRPRSREVQRDEFRNRFDRPEAVRPFRQDVPYRWSPGLAAALLSDTLNRPVTFINVPFDPQARTLYGLPVDAYYQLMMKVSDNLLAEHLLLSASGQDSLNSRKAIETMLTRHLADLPDKAIWVDGSGLSRYNLFTPRSILMLLQKLYQKVPQERLFNLLAVGGQPGTLRSMFKSEKPFVFAKTGSLSGVYNLSGYLITRKGKLLSFSMMHNNFPGPVGDLRKRTEAFLTKIHERY